MVTRKISNTPDIIPGRPTVITTLAAIGSLWSVYQLYNLASLIYLNFLRPGSLDKYRQDAVPAWALITGASDGIGKGFAEELCARGFNVVLHGRNESKLQAVKDEFLKQWPQREIKLLVLDAEVGARSPSALNSAVKQITNLNLKVLINNVGGSGGLKPAWKAFHQRTAEETLKFIDLNTTFPTEITRTLLPQIIKNQPTLIMNIGSVTSEVPCAYGSVYSGTKAYIKAWSRSLSLEVKGEGHNVEVMGILVGSVSSGSQPAPITFFCPTSRCMARYSLDKVGCGKDVLWGYWPHHLEFGVIMSLPTAIMKKIILGYALEEKINEERDMKAQ
ncbi:short chain dehydrogenase [Corynespora cassiicola Philippines]|uniref:Short chain dehydrogenase n=1 Tax=Corynespora cassiicola Philippines TaxID=1448308 RepID=A0A2T2NWV0_CORCC|nr:short chain dehydrogenase [Corynespora cassiicola Philippines]